MKALPGTVLVHMSREPVDALGEVFMRLPFMRALRTWAPEAEITIVPGIGGQPYWEELLAPLTGAFFDHCIRDRLPDRTTHGYDLVVDLEGDPRNFLRLRSLARDQIWSTAWRGWMHFPHFPRYHGKNVARRYLGLLRQFSRQPLPSFWPWPVPVEYGNAARKLLPAGSEYVGIAPGAGVKSTGKLWPIENYIALACRQAELGRVPVILLGPGEAEWRDRFCSVIGARFPLQENEAASTGVPADPVLTFALAPLLSAAVTNCSGTGHILATGGAAMITLFGPSNPLKFRPFARTSIQLLPPGPGSPDVSKISLTVVLDAIERILEPASAERGRFVGGTCFPPEEECGDRSRFSTC